MTFFILDLLMKASIIGFIASMTVFVLLVVIDNFRGISSFVMSASIWAILLFGLLMAVCIALSLIDLSHFPNLQRFVYAF